MKAKYSLFCLLIISLFANSQECESVWYGQYGDASTDVYVDLNGNTYAFEGTTNLSEYHFVKYDPEGNLLFNNEFSMNGNQSRKDVVGNGESVFVIASFQRLVYSGQTYGDGVYENGVVMKFDLEGNLLWLKIFSSDSGVETTTGTVDSEGNLYVGGGTTFVKLNPDGKIIWTKESEGAARVNEMKITKSGDVVAALWLLSDDFAIGGELTSGDRSGAILKMSPEGNVHYLYPLSDNISFGTPRRHSQFVYDLATADNEIYFSGSIIEEFQYEDNLYNTTAIGSTGVLGKLSEQGELIWINFFDTYDLQRTDGDGGLGIDADSVYIITHTDFSQEKELYVNNLEVSIPDRNSSSYILSFDKNGAFGSGIPFYARQYSTLLGSQYIDGLLYVPGQVTYYNYQKDEDPLELKNKAFTRIEMRSYRIEQTPTIVVEPVKSSYFDSETVYLILQNEQEGQWIHDGLPIEGGIKDSVAINSTGYYWYENACGIVSENIHLTFTDTPNSLEADSLILVDFYDRATTFNTEWNNDSGWLVEPLEDWFGVTVEDGRVIGLELPSNNLWTSVFDFRNLTELERLDLSGPSVASSNSYPNYSENSSLKYLNLSNMELDKVSDISSFPFLDTVDLRGNPIDLVYLEPNASIPHLLFDEIDMGEASCSVATVGEIEILDSKVNGEFTNYMWSKDGEELDFDGSILTFANFSDLDAGLYEVQISNSVLTSIDLAYSHELVVRSLDLPLGSFNAASTIQIDDTTYFTSDVIEITWDESEAKYKLSDISAGLWKTGIGPSHPYKIKMSEDCLDITIERDDTLVFPNGIITYDNATKTLIAPWQNLGDPLTGVTTIVFPENIQSIEFPEIGDIAIGDELVLEAVASSGENVQYELVKGESSAVLSGDTLLATSSGLITIRASHPGNNSYSSAFAEISLFIGRRRTQFTFESSQFYAYDEMEKSFDFSVDQDSLELIVLYNGSITPPSEVGIYEVRVIGLNDFYFGSISGTIAIEPVVTFESTSVIYNGTEQEIIVNTFPENLVIEVTYDGESTLPRDAGEYLVEALVMKANYSSMVTSPFVIHKAVAEITISDKNHVYDGVEKLASVTTTPEGLSYLKTYDDEFVEPLNVGKYIINVQIDELNYEGESIDTLRISKALGEIDISDLETTYNGSEKSAKIVTTPVGLDVSVLYDGVSDLPLDAGNYVVKVDIDELNYEGELIDTLRISKALGEIDISDLETIYNGSEKSAKIVTTPVGLGVSVLYDGVSDLPLDAGNYVVKVDIDELNYEGESIDTLRISKAPGEIDMSNLTTIYDGKQKPVSVTTTPSGLNVKVWYDNSPDVPLNSGIYSVEVTIEELNYFGNSFEELEIEKALAQIVVSDTIHVMNGLEKEASIETVPGNLSIDVTYNNSKTLPSNEGTYSLKIDVNEQNYKGFFEGVFLIEKILGANEEDRFKFYPNPVSDELNISFNSVSDVLRITVFDLQGREIINQEVKRNKIDVSTLKSGLYIFELRKDKELIHSGKLIKE